MIRFLLAGAVALGAQDPAEASRRSKRESALPKGIAVTLALDQPIDTATAAAGDPVAATVSGAVVDLPSGAVVRGRITCMEHRLQWPPHFLIALRFDRLESNGRILPFFARLESREGRIESHTRVDIDKTWIFPTRAANYVVPRGYESRWITTEPPR